MLTTILISLVVILVVFLLFVAMRPADFRVTRTATITAPAAIVFEQVNDLHKWEAWSPWHKMEPEAGGAYEGPASGVGASHSWAGKKTGEGRMTITESTPTNLVRFRLDFMKPFKGTNVAEFVFTPQGDQTTVTWSMTGTNNFVMKVFGLFMDCDKMVGGQFESGLRDLKVVCEGMGK